MPTSRSPPTPRSRPRTDRPANGAWQYRWSLRSATSPTTSSMRSRNACRSCASGRGTDPDAEIGPLITREHRDRVCVVPRRRGDGRRVDRRRRARPRLRRGRVLPRRVARRRRAAGHARVRRRDLRPGARVAYVPRRTTTRCSSSTTTRTATGARSSPATVARPASSSSMSSAAWSVSTCPSRCRSAYYSFGGWKSSLFGDTAIYGPAGIDFYTRTKVVTSRWPDPVDVDRRPRVPAHPADLAPA